MQPMFANSVDQIWLRRLLCFGKILHPLAYHSYFLANVWAARGWQIGYQIFGKVLWGQIQDHTRHTFCDFVISYNGALEKLRNYVYVLEKNVCKNVVPPFLQRRKMFFQILKSFFVNQTQGSTHQAQIEFCRHYPFLPVYSSMMKQNACYCQCV